MPSYVRMKAKTWKMQKLVGSLIYLTLNHHDISHVVGVVSRYMEIQKILILI